MIPKIISATISNLPKRRAKEISRDFGFNLFGLAHGGIIFAPVRKSLKDGNKTSDCLKKVLTNYALSWDFTSRKTKDSEFQFP